MTTAIAEQQIQSSETLFEDLRKASLGDIRAAIRDGDYQGHTAGLAADYLQGNVVILPESHALDFFRFCQRNPKPCPLVGVSDTGSPMMLTLGADIDIRTDVPQYRVFRDGDMTDEVSDISDLWRGDFVAFVLGCSFTFEDALEADGIRLAHIAENKTVPMFRTSVPTTPAGPFSGPIVVSMRSFTPNDAIRATVITSRFPHAHGEPLHVGDPSVIGIADINAPDWGDPIPVPAGHTPAFWACGVTPQAALQAAKPPICITHAPGRMLITDIPSWATAGTPPAFEIDS